MKSSKKASRPPTECRIRHAAPAGLGTAAALLALLSAGAAGSPPAAGPGAAATRPAPRFVNTAREAGLVLNNVSGEIKKLTIDETVGNGVCLYDVDGDDRIDVFIPNGSRKRPFPAGEAPRSALYRNRGDGTFEDVTERAGVASRGYWAQGCAFGDYDDDGRPDLFLTGFGRYILYRNLGDGKFQDVTRSSGLGGRGWSTGAAFGDYEGDGRLDLYVSHYVDFDPAGPPLPLPGSLRNCFYKGTPVICGPGGLKKSIGRLFHNEGGGKFRDVTRQAGLVTEPSGYGLGAVWTDLDLDGDLDLYVANDSTPSWLYRNDGRGRFTEIGAMAGAAYSEDGRAQSGMGVASGDYDNDGWFDLMVTNFSHDYSTLRHNDGSLQFTDVSMFSGVGVATLPYLGWGTGFPDYDNDGRADLFIANGHVFPGIDEKRLGTTWKQPNQLFHNEGGGRFQEVTSQAGPGFQELHSARGAAFGDLDDDGDIDIVVNNIDEPPSLLRNDGGNASRWIGFRLAGAPRNRGAVGARVTVVAGSLRQVKEIQAGSSHNSSNDPRLLFGLGTAPSVDRIEVRWPGGRIQALTGLQVGRYHVIREPEPGHP
ncbi:MAG TPA: CRTAC1 family protein [Candidatus Polarisedimenticolia bacterium]|nr:CRTAC1 family protein [Candidatus Polarisedimenticolia bacterium]